MNSPGEEAGTKPPESPVQEFERDKRDRIASYRKDGFRLKEISAEWLKEAYRCNYMYNFEAQGRPIIQLPQDIVALQELTWRVKPDLIIETGIAHGGSLVAHAMHLAAIGRGHVLGIDIDIRAHNRVLIESHPLAQRITMIEGSSIEDKTISEVHDFAAEYERILLVLDSNHTHEHVLQELLAYAPLVSIESYCVVLDTIIEDLPVDAFPGRPWGIGNNPRTAIREYLGQTDAFETDDDFEAKLLITCAPGGFLRRVS